MKTLLFNQRRAPRGRAFSLVEILVAMGLLSFIVLGLLVMFNQTQRAFRESMTQTDVLEGARAVVDMVVRDMQDVAPANQPPLVNGQEFYNFFTETTGPGAVMDLPGTAATRPNSFQRFFCLGRNNQDLVGVGYKVQVDGFGFGTLYRWTRTNTPFLGLVALSDEFTRAGNASPLGPEFNRIADGIVHLRVTACATNGYTIMNAPLPQACFFVDDTTNVPPFILVHDAVVNNGPQGQESSYFAGRAVPAFVELELGILEPQVLKRARGMSAAAAANYLSNRVAQVHIFRQRIPIRNVDYSAYQ